MTEKHALLLRVPKDVAYPGYWPERTYRTHDTHVMARGTYPHMNERWAAADARIRKAIKAGLLPEGTHVMVRSCDDPTAIRTVVPDRRRGGLALTTEGAAVPRFPDFDPDHARWCVLSGDSVSVDIYGNRYGAVVVKANPKAFTVRARFSGRTFPERENTFDLRGGYRTKPVHAVRYLLDPAQ